MKLRRLVLLVLVSSLVVAFVAVLVGSVLWSPSGDTFRVFVAKEAAKVTLQLLGLTAVGGIASELVREARERRDFASRLRHAYGKAKARRRRLRRSHVEGRSTELDLLDDIQLEFEDLRDEAEWMYGSRSPVVTNLTLIENYLHDVVDAGFPAQAGTESNVDAFQDFVAKYRKESRFASDFKKPYHFVWHSLR